MPSKYQNSTIKVPQSVIDQIKELGMAAAIKKAKSGSASKEFVEGVRRFYPAAVKGASGIDSKTTRRSTSGAGVKTKKAGPAPVETGKGSSKGPQVASASIRRRLSDSGRSNTVPNRVPGSSAQGSGAAALAGLGRGLGNVVGGASEATNDLMNNANSGFATYNDGRVDFDFGPSDRGIRGLDDRLGDFGGYVGRNVAGAGRGVADLFKWIAANTDSGLR